MVTLSKVYKTQIDSTTYEPAIDSDDNEITIKLLDFNNEPVKNEKVVVTCDKGKFIQYRRNSSVTKIKNGSSSYTGTTGSNGEFYLKYEASEWGFVNIVANNMNVKLFVTGWRTISTFNSNNYVCTYTTYGNQNYADPFPRKEIKYDDSIGVVVFSLVYDGKWAQINSSVTSSSGWYNFSSIDRIVLATFKDNSVVSSSTIPNYIFNFDNGEALYQHWYRGDILAWIDYDGSISVRAYNELSSTHNTILVGTEIGLRIEKTYYK